MESVDGNCITLLSISARADFHETRTTAVLYKTLIIEFHENPTIDLAAYTRSQMDRSMWSPCKALFFEGVKNARGTDVSLLQ
jgi:hypothetical protein